MSLKAAAAKRRTRTSKGKTVALAEVSEEPTVRLNVNVPESLHRDFKLAAIRERVGMSELVIGWMKKYVKQHSRDE